MNYDEAERLLDAGHTLGMQAGEYDYYTNIDGILCGHYSCDYDYYPITDEEKRNATYYDIGILA